MKRVRLYELAKELRLDTRQVVADARRLGVMVSSPSSSVDEKTADRIRELYYPKKPAATEHRAARLVKAHKPAATPGDRPEAPAAPRHMVKPGGPEPAPAAAGATTQASPRTAGGTRIIKLAQKPASMRPASAPRPVAQPSTEERPASHVGPPADE